MPSDFTEAGLHRALERWGAVGDTLAQRVYTSRLLGERTDWVLHGGGNTSAKGVVRDVLGDEVETLWVKGSGWDLATIEPEGFTPVALAYVRRLRSLDALSDEDMVAALQAHKLSASAPNPSIETLLHAWLPHRFVDHSHADAIVAVTNLEDGPRRIREALGPDIALVPYVKPGFDLAKLAADVHDQHPGCIGLVLLKHGLFTFGATAQESFLRHAELVGKAQAYLKAAGAPAPIPRDEATARQAAARLAPLLRRILGQVDGTLPLLAHRVDAHILGALDGGHVEHWSVSGPLTPDHVIRTKPHPLWIDRSISTFVRSAPEAEVIETLRQAVDAYVKRYDSYVKTHAEAAGGIDRFVRLPPGPRVIWVWGVGLFAAGRTARDVIGKDVLSPPSLQIPVRGQAAPVFDRRLVPEKGNRQQFVRVGQALEPFDRNEPVDLVDQRPHLGGDVQVFVLVPLGGDNFEDDRDHWRPFQGMLRAIVLTALAERVLLCERRRGQGGEVLKPAERNTP